jgi:hypothetical protein
MAEYEQKRRLPVWRTSEGRLRETAPAPQREGRDHLTGYEPGTEERDRPREAARLAGSYGDVAVGTTKKRELTMVVSRRRSREGPAARREEQQLHAESARPMNLARGDFRVNAHAKEDGALAYRESREKASIFLLERFREMMRTHRPGVAEEQLAFLDRQGEKKALRQLQSRADTLRAAGGPGARAELRALERQKQTLRQELSEKATQERRLRLLLDRAQEESRRRSGETEQARWVPVPAAAELPPEDGGAGGGSAPGKPQAGPPKGGQGSAESAAPQEKSAAPREENVVPQEENVVPQEENAAPQEENAAPQRENVVPQEENTAPQEEGREKKQKNF